MSIFSNFLQKVFHNLFLSSFKKYSSNCILAFIFWIFKNEVRLFLTEVYLNSCFVSEDWLCKLVYIVDILTPGANRFPGLKGWSWEFREAKAARVGGTECCSGESCTQLTPELVRGPLEYSGEHCEETTWDQERKSQKIRWNAQSTYQFRAVPVPNSQSGKHHNSQSIS